MAAPKLGSGKRFARLSSTLAAKGAHNPDALAAWIGARKYGAKGMGHLSHGKSLANPDLGIYLAETTKDDQGLTLTCPECGHIAPAGDFGASGTNLTPKPGDLRTPAPSTGQVRAGAATTVRGGSAAHALTGDTRDAINLAAGTLTARRHPIGGPADVLVARAQDGTAVLRHRHGGGQIATLAKTDAGQWQAVVNGKPLAPRDHQRTALMEAVGTYNKAVTSALQRAEAPLQPPPQQTELMAEYGIPAIRALATPTVGASDGPRMTTAGGDVTDGDGLTAKGKAIKAKLIAKGFPEARAIAFAKMSQKTKPGAFGKQARAGQRYCTGQSARQREWPGGAWLRRSAPARDAGVLAARKGRRRRLRAMAMAVPVTVRVVWPAGRAASLVTAAVLTPFTTAGAVELGNRQWRKKVLPVGDVEYKGRLLHFTRDYLGQLAAAFTGRAYDQVPFQLADAANTHTNDPERTRGEITAMELGDDGLYITAELTEDGEKVLAANPKLGVSARIVEDYARSDGKHYPAAIQHVLGTLDPRIPGLGGWEAIEAASPVPDEVIDLSASVFAGGGGAEHAAPPAPPQPVPAPAAQEESPEGTGTMPDLDALTDEQKARLAALLDLPDEQLDALAAGGLVLTPDELLALTGAADDGPADEEPDDEDEVASEITAMTDEEFTAMQAAFEAEQTQEEPVAAGMSAEAQFSIDLAVARQEETARELSVITARLREQDYQAEKRKLADLGVPPFITELARPLLEGNGRTVELANGKTADAGQVMRQVLTQYAQQVKLLDLDVELGSPMDEPEDAGREQRDAGRDEIVSRYKQMTGLK